MFSLRLDFVHGFWRLRFDHRLYMYMYLSFRNHLFRLHFRHLYLSHALFHSLTLSRFTNGLIPYALNVIPLDLFCLSGISCRVIDYGQFSKHPTANTWSISLLFFINVVAVVVVVFYRHFILIRVRLLELHFGFYLWASVSINRVRFSIVLLFIQVILSSKYNLIDFVDFA